jgi:hypothetical protein
MRDMRENIRVIAWYGGLACIGDLPALGLVLDARTICRIQSAIVRSIP